MSASRELREVVKHAHDTHLAERHPQSVGWEVHEGCAFCDMLAVARTEVGLLPPHRVSAPEKAHV